MSDRIKVFVGTDESQLGASEVLKQSILETSSDGNIDVVFMNDIKIPAPKDIRQSQRTGFSFARWAIPELCGYKGRAIYVDADMMVFKDIRGLWETPMNGATVAIVDGTVKEYCWDKAKGNKNETSVMLIDCEKAKWSLQGLIDGLDGTYHYKDMMSDLCFLKPEDVMHTIPRYWNSMDYWDETVRLIHFTNVPTQPWVSVDNPFGYVWVNHLRRMIADGKIKRSYIDEQIAKGYFRPSLAVELDGAVLMPNHSAYADTLKKVDKEAKFIPHKAVFEYTRKRERAIRMYEVAQAFPNDMSAGIKLAANLAIDETKQVIKKVLGRA